MCCLGSQSLKNSDPTWNETTMPKKKMLWFGHGKTQLTLFPTAKILAVMSMTNDYFMDMNSDFTVHFNYLNGT